MLWRLLRQQRLLCVLAARASAEYSFTLQPGWPPLEQLEAGVAKRLTLIRHAEGWHNKDGREMANYYSDKLFTTDTYWDARLTPEGEKQAYLIAVKQQWRQQKGLPEVVVVSPLTRAIQTATIGFPNTTTANGIKFVAPPFVATSLARERIWIHSCDRRRPRHELEAEFPHVNFADVAHGDDEMWDNKEDQPSADDSAACTARARALLEWLWARPEKDIAVVTHWVFLRQLFRMFPDRLEWSGPFGNAELRHVSLVRSVTAPSNKDEV